jgi:hypothetical protein
MPVTQRLYRLTQASLTSRLHLTPPKPVQTPHHPLINLDSLTRFAAGVLLHEYETVLVPSDNDLPSPRLTSKEVTKKCNPVKWEAKLSGRQHPPLNDEQDQNETTEGKEPPPLPTSRAGVIYVSTTISDTPTTDQDSMSSDASKETSTGREGGSEKITSFLFAHYEPTIPELQPRLKTDLFLPPPNPPGQSLFSEEDPEALTSVPARIQKLIDELGVTRLWLCGTDPGYRRLGLMTTNLRLLEQEVLHWKSSSRTSHDGIGEKRKEEEDETRVSGVVTAHTAPLRFPGMVQLLIKSGFKGGDRIKISEDKVFYWKEIK